MSADAYVPAQLRCQACGNLFWTMIAAANALDPVTAQVRASGTMRVCDPCTAQGEALIDADR